MARVVLDPDFIPHVEVEIRGFMDNTLGPLITADMKRYAPKRTGNMAELIFWEVEGLTLYVVSPAFYTLWVELGHHVFHPSTGMVGPESVPEEPFMRPALYKYRTPANVDPPATFPVAVAHPGGPSLPTLLQYEEERLGWTPSSKYRRDHPSAGA